MQSVYEYAWLATQQVVVSSDKDGSRIKGFGSGFFLQYKKRLFFVTADHVAHIDDFQEGIRLGKDDYVWIFNNINNKEELSTILTPIGGLYYFDMSNLNDSLSFEIPDMKDITFKILSNSFHYPFLANELKIENKVIVESGREKIIINSDSVAEMTNNDYCIIEGCVKFNIVNGIKIERFNTIYQDLKFDSIDIDGNYILKYPYHVIYENWAGLSGGPIFNDRYQLIGMVIRVNEYNDTIVVMPIKEILRYMDYAIAYENNMK